MDIAKWNKWWVEKEVSSNLIGLRREIFYKILKYLDKRQIIVIKGIRRVGKTTLLYQFIDYLIKDKKINPYHILYYSFDEEIREIDDIMKTFESEVLRKKISSFEKLYIFFDEIQKLKNWPNKIKILYDLNPNTKIFISGSSSLDIEKGSKESLAGRSFEFIIEPLSFSEYLSFKNISVDLKRLDIYRKELQIEFNHYLMISGFIEVINEYNDEILSKYFLESIINRVIFIDIPQIFKIDEPELLRKILKAISSNPGMLLEYKSLADDFGRDRRTIENYISYLKNSLLIKILYNYSKNYLSMERKLKKVYISIFGLPLHLFSEKRNDEDFLGKVTENLLISAVDPLFFYRSPDKREIDVVLTGKKIIPLEIKYKNVVSKRDLSGIIYFLRKFNFKNGLLITKETKKDEEIEGRKIKLIPLLDFLLTKESGELALFP